MSLLWIIMLLTLTGCVRSSGDGEQPLPPIRLEPPESATPYGSFDVHKRHGLGGWSKTPGEPSGSSPGESR